MLNFVDNLSVKLVSPVAASADSLKLSAIDAVKLNKVGVGNHIYLTLVQGGVSEVVKYTHVAPISGISGPTVVAVERDVNGTGRKNFAPGTCATAVWNALQLTEFICTTVANCPAGV